MLKIFIKYCPRLLSLRTWSFKLIKLPTFEPAEVGIRRHLCAARGRENALDQRFVRFSPLLQANFPSDRKRQLVVPTIQYMKTFASFTLTTRVLKESVASSDQTYQRTASPSKLLESCRRWGKGFY